MFFVWCIILFVLVFIFCVAVTFLDSAFGDTIGTVSGIGAFCLATILILSSIIVPLCCPEFNQETYDETKYLCEVALTEEDAYLIKIYNEQAEKINNNIKSYAFIRQFSFTDTFIDRCENYEILPLIDPYTLIERN